MAEVIVKRDLITENEPAGCINCPNNLVQSVIDFVSEHQKDISDAEDAEAANLVAESIRRCRRINGCDEDSNPNKPLVRSI